MDRTGTIVHSELTCRLCGYTLRGLPTDGECPECRFAIFESMRGDHLRFADPRWLNRRADGLAWLTGVLLLVLLNAFMDLYAGATSGAALLLAGVRGPLVIFTLIMLWLLTRPEPGGDLRESPWSPRRFARFGGVALVMLAIINLLRLWIDDPGLLHSMNLAALVLLIPAGVATVGLGLDLSHLAARLRHHTLRRDARILSWCMMLLLLLYGLFRSGEHLGWWAERGHVLAFGWQPMETSVCLFGPLAVVFIGWSLLTIQRTRHDLLRARQDAIQHSQKEPRTQ